MAFITVRIAGKPATWRWPIHVSTDSKHIEIKLDADPRFAAAAAGGARYLGEASGLTTDAAGKFQAAILFACEEAFAHLDVRHTEVKVTLNQFPDRIEVAIVHHANAPSVGLHTLLGAGSNAMEGVDRVQYEQQAENSVTRLTKFLGPHA
ncbi:MAG TPA: hypothetical protein VN025_01645 [Candidatus Dormibacteraeota bacterium]|jgi:hypothetical protein|nr:hypothetical protein [Candidatus Dormibacteraeota bacterium]